MPSPPAAWWSWPSSPHASLARQAVIEAFTQLPAPPRQALERSVNGGVDDIDRSIHAVLEASDGGAIGVVVTYNSDRLPDASPVVRTAVRCTLDAADDWACAERPLEATAEHLGVTLRRNGRYVATADLEALVRAVLSAELGRKLPSHWHDHRGVAPGPQASSQNSNLRCLRYSVVDALVTRGRPPIREEQ